MKLLFLVSNRSHCESANRIIKTLKYRDHSLDIRFIVQDRYMNTECSGLLKSYGYDHVSVPRKLSGKSLWNDPSSILVNIWTIIKYFSNVVRNIRPDLSIILPYEKGAIELSFIRACRKYGIDTLLLQEGLIITDENKEARLTDKSAQYFHVKQPNSDNVFTLIQSIIGTTVSMIKRRLKYPRTILYDFKYLPAKIYIRKYLKGYPFGMNGTDWIGTMSEYYSQKLIDRGIEKYRVKATGLPRFDKIPELLRDNDFSLDIKRGKVASTIKILFPQTWGYTTGSNVFADVTNELVFLKMLKSYFKDNSIEISYRLRYEEDISDYTEQIRSHADIVFEEGKIVSAYESIMNHTIIISTGSTMILEALALHRYAILYDRNSKDTYGFRRSGACLSGSNAKEVADAIKTIITDMDKRSGLQKAGMWYVAQRAMIDGESAERTAMFIESIVHNSIKVKGIT